MLLSNYTNRLFSVSGKFPSPTPENTVFLGPRVREGEMGYHIVQPLERSAGGGQIIVDRGFVPVTKIINFKGDPSTWRLLDVSDTLTFFYFAGRNAMSHFQRSCHSLHSTPPF
jgi:hypothetical protein